MREGYKGNNKEMKRTVFPYHGDNRSKKRSIKWDNTMLKPTWTLDQEQKSNHIKRTSRHLQIGKPSDSQMHSNQMPKKKKKNAFAHEYI